MNPRYRLFILKSRTIWSRTKAPAKPMLYCAKRFAKSGKVGVAQFVLRNRESLCVLKAQGDALTLNTLRFASEIRSADELRLPVNEKLVPNEVNLALKLIEGMTAEFEQKKPRKRGAA